jgi:hypothetical protein
MANLALLPIFFLSQVVGIGHAARTQRSLAQWSAQVNTWQVIAVLMASKAAIALRFGVLVFTS